MFVTVAQKTDLHVVLIKSYLWQYGVLFSLLFITRFYSYILTLEAWRAILNGNVVLFYI